MGAADLAGQVHGPAHQCRDEAGHVGVVEDDGRRLPAELERDPLDLLAAQAHDPLSGRRRSGERDLVGAGMPHQVLADLAAGRYHVDHAPRNTRFG